MTSRNCRAATMSVEVDILPIADGNEETGRLADLIEGVAGELSPFEELHGFSIDGVDPETAVLPEGWHGRLVTVQNANTAAAFRCAVLHRLVLRQGIPLCREAARLPREGPQLRRRTCRSRPRGRGSDRIAATDAFACARRKGRACAQLARLVALNQRDSTVTRDATLQDEQRRTMRTTSATGHRNPIVTRSVTGAGCPTGARPLIDWSSLENPALAVKVAAGIRHERVECPHPVEVLGTHVVKSFGRIHPVKRGRIEITTINIGGLLDPKFEAGPSLA